MALREGNGDWSKMEISTDENGCLGSKSGLKMSYGPLIPRKANTIACSGLSILGPITLKFFKKRIICKILGVYDISGNVVIQFVS